MVFTDSVTYYIIIIYTERRLSLILTSKLKYVHTTYVRTKILNFKSE